MDPLAEELATRSATELGALVRAAQVGARELVEGALERIEAGTYGTCQRCGKPISEERLEALPYAELCIDCKRAVERG